MVKSVVLTRDTDSVKETISWLDIFTPLVRQSSRGGTRWVGRLQSDLGVQQQSASAHNSSQRTRVRCLTVMQQWWYRAWQYLSLEKIGGSIGGTICDSSSLYIHTPFILATSTTQGLSIWVHYCSMALTCCHSHHKNNGNYSWSKSLHWQRLVTEPVTEYYSESRWFYQGVSVTLKLSLV